MIASSKVAPQYISCVMSTVMSTTNTFVLANPWRYFQSRMET